MRISHLRCAGLAIATAALFSSSITSLSQPVIRHCGPDGAGLLGHLEKEEGEHPEAIGFTASGKIVYVMVNPQERDYSLITIALNGEGCLISVGSDWEWLEDGS